MSIPIEVVREVADLLQESGLHEIVVESSEGVGQAPFRLKMRRETVRPTAKGAPAPVGQSGESTHATPEGIAQPAAPSLLDIAATAVGIYRAPVPAVNVGDTVRRKQVVAIVESMKIPNEILAPADGQIVEILAVPAAGVEYGQVLLRIQAAQ